MPQLRQETRSAIRKGILARIARPDLDWYERSSAVEALCDDQDTRSIPALRKLLDDRTSPDAVRSAAAEALTSVDEDVAAEQLQAWWHHGDQLLQLHALRSMGPTRCPEIVLSVAADPQHAWYGVALDRMTEGFWRPEHQITKTRGLYHLDAAVRAQAAAALSFDCPLAAEVPLTRCLEDSNLEVVSAAASTLELYPTLGVLQAFVPLVRYWRSRAPKASEADGFELDEDLDDDLDDATVDALVDAAVGEEPEDDDYELYGSDVLRVWGVLWRELAALLVNETPQVVADLRKWLGPLWSELAELQPPSVDGWEPEPESLRSMDFAQIRGLALDPETSLVRLEGLGQVELTEFSERQRAELLELLITTEDPARLCLAARLAVRAEDGECLAQLLRAPWSHVRRAALAGVVTLRPAPQLGEALEAFDRRLKPHGNVGVDVMSGLALHSQRACEILEQVAADGERDPLVRARAVECLGDKHGRSELQSLTGLLSQAPVVNWGLQVALLNALWKCKLSVSGRLRETVGGGDWLDVRVAWSRLRSAGLLER